MSDEGLGRKLLRGSAWMIASRWSMRLMGLVSMMVVARLLAPEDFGIYAIAVTFIGLLDALTDLGTDLAIIRHPRPVARHYDTAWTLSLAAHVVVAALIAAFAPLAVYLYDDARLAPVLLVMAGAALIGGLTNIGVADFRRRLDFAKDFRFNVLVQLVGVGATVALAFLLRDYWALVLGGLARSLARVALSYRLHPYRPRLSLAARGEMLGFSFWMVMRAVAMFASSRGERLVVGAYFGPALTGIYALASDFASMIVFELLHPIGRALFPGLALKQGDVEWERRNLPVILNVAATLSVAMGFGLAAIAAPAMTLVFGAQFAQGGPFLAVFALQMALAGMTQPVVQYLTVHGYNRDLALLFLLQGVLTILCTAILAESGASLQTIIHANLAISLIAFVRLYHLVRLRKDRLSVRATIVGLIRPLVAGAAMYLCVTQALGLLALPPAIAVLVGMTVGAIVYPLALWGVWLLMRRPAGFEELAGQLLSSLRRVRK